MNQKDVTAESDAITDPAELESLREKLVLRETLLQKVEAALDVPKGTRYPLQPDMERRIQNNFTYHPVKGDQENRYVYLRTLLRELSREIVELSPASREQSVALTKLEEVGFWTFAGIARNE